MQRIITHLPETYVFDIDFSISAIVAVLREVAARYMGAQNFTLDLTTIQGDYHYDITFDQLGSLMHQYKEVVNSITLSEVENKEIGHHRSVVLYLNNTPGNHDISLTVASTTEEENVKIGAFIVQKIDEQRDDHKLYSKARLNHSLLFDEFTPANQIITFLNHISNQFLKDVPFDFDVVTNKEVIFNMSQEQLPKLKNIIRKQDHHIITAYKLSPKGSFLEVSLYFQKHSPGFCYFSMASDKKSTNSFIKKLICEKLELSSQAKLQHKKQLINRPQLQGVFKVDNRLKADQIVDAVEEVSRHFMSMELLDLRLLTPEKSSYCYAENQCDNLRALFRKNKEGILFATKSNSRGHMITMNLQFRDLNEISAYYFILLRSNKENETVRDFMIRRLGEREGDDDDIQFVVKPQLQDAFSFDRNMPVEEVIDFLKHLSTTFLTDEIISVRLSTINGEKHYFYDEEYNELVTFFRNDVHDMIYVSLKENGGSSISVNLQFKSAVAGTNGYFSIVMDDEEQNFQVMEFILKNLKSQPALKSRKAKTTEKSTDKNLVITDSATSLKGNFRFNENLNADRIIAFMNALVRHHLSGEQFVNNKRFNFNIRNFDGSTHVNLDYNTFRSVFMHEKPLVHILSCASITETGRYIELAFIFGESEEKENGHFTIQCGNEALNIKAQEFILHTLDPTHSTKNIAKPDHSPKPEEAPAKESNKEPKTGNLTSTASPEEEAETPQSEDETEPEPVQVFISLGQNAETESLVKDLITKTLDTLEIKWVMPAGLDGFKVLDDIIYNLEKSSVAIIDISSNDPSTWYELGLAHSNKKHIILLTDNADELPFDFKRFDHVIYTKSKRGLERLAKELKVYLGK